MAHLERLQEEEAAWAAAANGQEGGGREKEKLITRLDSDRVVVLVSIAGVCLGTFMKIYCP